jgi:translation initiation factor 6 (eIF-6)
MTTITFDTYHEAKILEKAGFNPCQVEAHIEITNKHSAIINELIDNDLATKHDIALIHKDIEDLRQATKKDIKTVLWVVGISFTIIGLLNVGLGLLIALHY